MVEYFSSTLADLQTMFRAVILQETVNTCFCKKELHSRRYLRSFKNAHGLKLHFAGL